VLVAGPNSNPGRSTARGPAKDTQGRLATAEAKEVFLDRLAQGETIIPAARHVGRTREGYEYWRKQDKVFAEQVDIILARRKGAVVECPDFPEFCEEYLRQPLWLHQLQWWDVLQGKAPRDLHPAMRWSQGDQQMLLINTPPGHAKSTVLTTNYVTWRICRDPNVRVVIVSATEKMAKKFLYAVKQRLTNPSYAELQRKFGPEGSFRATAESWTATEIYLQKDDGEKDPTVQAIGMGGQIYGARADLIIVDDAVLLKNAHQWEDQIDWLTQEVVTRLPEELDYTGNSMVGASESSKLIVVGTRMRPADLYQKLRDEFTDEDGEPVFTYFSQPAVLEYAEDPKDWVTLWPETHSPVGEVIPKWPGELLKKRRAKVRPSTWAMVYQQQDASEDGVFDEAMVRAACDGMRKPGPVPDTDRSFGRPGGMRGLYVVCGLDPATAGFTAGVALGVDRQARKIWLLDAFNRQGVLPRQTKELIESWTQRFGVNEWVIEENAYQKALVQDDEIRSYLFSRGVILKGHHTGRYNKSDADFGVASMSVLFEPDAEGKPTLLLPNANVAFPAVSQLVEQLCMWQPDVKNQRQDLVMALWFAARRARQLIFQAPGRQKTHMDNAFLSRGHSKKRTVINLNDVSDRLLQEQYMQM
jgi:hypothetical protein